MCCDTTRGAQRRKMSDRSLRAWRSAAVRQLAVVNRVTKTVWRGVEASMTASRIAIRQQ